MYNVTSAGSSSLSVTKYDKVMVLVVMRLNEPHPIKWSHHMWSIFTLLKFFKTQFLQHLLLLFLYKSMITHLIIILPGCKSWHPEVVDDVGVSIMPDRRQ